MNLCCFRRAILAAIVFAYCFQSVPSLFAQGQDGVIRPNTQAPKTIDIVAVVNGEKVSRQKLAQDCLIRYGEQVLENMVYKQLILGACQENNIVITQKDINNEVARMAQRASS